MKKTWIIIIIILGCYLLLMLLLFSGKEEEDPQEKRVIKKYFEIEKRSEQSLKTEKLNQATIDVLKNEFKTLAIDGYNDFYKPTNYQVEKLNANNLDYFKNYVKSINDLKNLTVNQKIVFDFDGDGTLEQLLLISNVDDKSAKRWISAVYYIDKKIDVIYFEKFNFYDDLNPKYNFIDIADLNNDGFYEILLQLSPNRTTCYSIFELIDEKYEPVILCDLPTV